MSNLWFVESGPDASHLFDVAYFDKLRDAKNFAENLPMTPTGMKRPYRIKKHEYIGHRRFSNTVTVTQVTHNARLSGAGTASA
jgi:hypothetical protein